MKTKTIYRYFVTCDHGAHGCWVCAVDDADAIKKACAKLKLDYKQNAAAMNAHQIGKAGVQVSE